MPDRQFESLRLELLRSGVSPIYVERTIFELADHYADLESAALSSGLCADEAARAASAAIGNERAIAAAVLAHPELLHSAATIGSLPGLPLMFCIEHRPELARWGAAVSVAVTLMGSVLAMLNWLIVLPF
jgi:hypothetical protein